MPSQYRSPILLLAILIFAAALAPTLHAHVFEWEWIVPANPALGKQPSATMCPDGFELDPVPGMEASSKDLTKGYLIDFNLTNADFSYATLINADFWNSNLTDANFLGATIDGANLRSAIANGFTQTQFELTASYATGYLAGVGLSDNVLIGWNFEGRNLTGADLTDTNLRNASLRNARLAGVDFAGAKIVGADFFGVTNSGVTSAEFKAQFESTTSYDVFGNLRGINLSGNDLTDLTDPLNPIAWNLCTKKLVDAQFVSSLLTDTCLTGANLRAASFLDATLTNADFTDTNLRRASFHNATLTSADFSGAIIAGADFALTVANGFTQTQFESTASYQNAQLSGVNLSDNDLNAPDTWDFAKRVLANAAFDSSTLTGADFEDANLTDVNFTVALLTAVTWTKAKLIGANFTKATLTDANLTAVNLAGANFTLATLSGADLTDANLTDTDFTNAAILDANLSGADARGALFMEFADAEVITSNQIDIFVQPDGWVEGLNIGSGGHFRVWDYDGLDTDEDGMPDTPLGITVGVEFSIDPAGTLIVGLEDNDWGSTIAFDAVISDITFAGTLEIELRDNFVPSPGDQWQLFDFTGVSVFDDFTAYLPPPDVGDAWDTSTLMSDGILRFLVANPLPGDANSDGSVDEKDAAILADNWQTASGATWGQGDFNGDDCVDGIDATMMAANWGHAPIPPTAVPEPSSIVLLLIAALTCLLVRRAKV